MRSRTTYQDEAMVQALEAVSLAHLLRRSTIQVSNPYPRSADETDQSAKVDAGLTIAEVEHVRAGLNAICDWSRELSVGKHNNQLIIISKIFHNCNFCLAQKLCAPLAMI